MSFRSGHSTAWWCPLLLLIASLRRDFLFPLQRGSHSLRSSLRTSERTSACTRAATPDVEVGGIWWLPTLNASEHLEPEDPSAVMPIFPLTGAYFPFSEMELSIFEPRYRQLYNDILVSGARRFAVVAPHPTEENRLAEVGVIFYLDELTDVSEESEDEVKYICNHRIIGRVRLRRILNPGAWEERSTYLRAEVEDYGDDDVAVDTTEQQEEVMALLKSLARRQEELGGPHFESHISDYANASCAEKGGLWTLADVFAEYFEFLQSEKEQTLDIDIEQVYRKYSLEDDDEDFPNFVASEEDVTKGSVNYELPFEDDDYEYEEVDLMELPTNARSELWRLQEQFEEEAPCLMPEASVLNEDLQIFVQEMLQSKSHQQRLEIMRRALVQEERRLAARKALQSVMMGTSEVSTEDDESR